MPHLLPDPPTRRPRPVRPRNMRRRVNGPFLQEATQPFRPAPDAHGAHRQGHRDGPRGAGEGSPRAAFPRPRIRREEVRDTPAPAEPQGAVERRDHTAGGRRGRAGPQRGSEGVRSLDFGGGVQGSCFPADGWCHPLLYNGQVLIVFLECVWYERGRKRLRQVEAL